MLRIMTVIKSALHDYGATGYIVGGFVRDRLLQIDTNDLDIVVDKDVFVVSRAVAEKLAGTLIVLDRENQVARVAIKQQSGRTLHLDFSALKGATIEEDLKHRDFTINAMAIPLMGDGNQLIDDVQGRSDLKAKKIRMVSPQAFAADPLRILRALRLAAHLDMEIDEATLKAMAVSAEKISAISGERIWEELSQLLLNADSYQYIRLANDRVDLWRYIFPQVNEMRGTEQNFYHRDNVWEHSLKTLCQLEGIIASPPLNHSIWSEVAADINRKLAANRSYLVVLKLACLLHDVGKTITQGRRPDGRITFYGHDKAGVKFVKDFAQRIKLSKVEKSALLTLVEYHMRPLALFNQPKVSAGAMYRLFSKLDNLINHCLLLSLADVTSTYLSTDNFEKLDQYRQYIGQMFHLAINEPEKYVHPPKLVTGHDLMQHLGLTSSKEVGQLLDEISLAQVEGLVQSREQALAYIKTKLK
ncbi:HD domain-containing protein [Peptococcaceae bacterium 1198_IL3148]